MKNIAATHIVQEKKGKHFHKSRTKGHEAQVSNNVTLKRI